MKLISMVVKDSSVEFQKQVEELVNEGFCVVAVWMNRERFNAMLQKDTEEDEKQ
jgi:hypothetical protein